MLAALWYYVYMIRSRDLLLFILAILFLSLLILGSTSVRVITGDHMSFKKLPTVELGETSYMAVSEINTRDRQDAITHLRSKLAEGSVIESSPSVESSPEISGTQTPDTIECSVTDTGISVARLWPLSDVSVEVREGVRIVSQNVTISQSILTSTTSVQNEIAITRKLLLRLPLSPVRQSVPTCPQSEIVGVTPAGSLLFNSDATLYRLTGSETLIGYALDGIPIYGPTSKETDQCGGYESPEGYRYAVSDEVNKVLHCFIAKPNDFQNI